MGILYDYPLTNRGLTPLFVFIFNLFEVIMVFPEYRPRRMRQNAAFRAMIRETRLDAAQLILPVFVMPGKGLRETIPSMPGVRICGWSGLPLPVT